MKRVRVRAILGHEQPAGEAGFNHMEAGAGRRLRELRQLDEGVAVHPAFERRPVFELAGEARGIHP